mmetsp:Transcript_17635/g.49940  ORF Transcript_17635/g.49940 Transcript_17635/m.49940 type:complete len:320 (+) Transcript_17635:432-1391(+)
MHVQERIHWMTFEEIEEIHRGGLITVRACISAHMHAHLPNPIERQIAEGPRKLIECLQGGTVKVPIPREFRCLQHPFGSLGLQQPIVRSAHCVRIVDVLRGITTQLVGFSLQKVLHQDRGAHGQDAIVAREFFRHFGVRQVKSQQRCDANKQPHRQNDADDDGIDTRPPRWDVGNSSLHDAVRPAGAAIHRVGDAMSDCGRGVLDGPRDTLGIHGDRRLAARRRRAGVRARNYGLDMARRLIRRRWRRHDAERHGRGCNGRLFRLRRLLEFHDFLRHVVGGWNGHHRRFLVDGDGRRWLGRFWGGRHCFRCCSRVGLWQ